MKFKIYNGQESLNSKLNEESYIRELEQRLETDPLTIGGIIEMQSDMEISMICKKEYLVEPCSEFII